MLEQIAKRKPEQETATAFRRNPKSDLPVLHSPLSTSKEFILALIGVMHSPKPVLRPPSHGNRHPKRPSPPKPSPPHYSFDADTGQDIIFAVNTQATNSGTQLKWKRYLLDKRLRRLLREAVSRKLSCRVMLVDAAGSEVAAKEIPSDVKIKALLTRGRNRARARISRLRYLAHFTKRGVRNRREDSRSW